MPLVSTLRSAVYSLLSVPRADGRWEERRGSRWSFPRRVCVRVAASRKAAGATSCWTTRATRASDPSWLCEWKDVSLLLNFSCRFYLHFYLFRSRFVFFIFVIFNYFDFRSIPLSLTFSLLIVLSFIIFLLFIIRLLVFFLFYHFSCMYCSMIYFPLFLL